jgi:proteasome accessory factor C
MLVSRATADVARMLALVPWLLERPGASLSEAADAFGVSERAIRADLGHLDFCGLPGLGGGDLFEIDIVGDRVILRMADELRRPLRPTPSEALRLVLTVDAVADVLGNEVPALRTAVAKVRAALGVPDEVADVLADQPTALLSVLRRALDDQRQLEVEYQGRADDRPRRRRIHPWGLHVEDGRWYLQGHDDDADAARIFRLDRILDARALPEPIGVERPDPLPVPRYQPGDGDQLVVLELEPSARWLEEAIEVDTVEDVANDRRRIRFRTGAPGWIAELVLTAAGGARVVEPSSLRARVRDQASSALDALERVPIHPGR